MNFEQYRKETLRTLPDLGSLCNNSLHMTVGMMTECVELAQAIHVENEDNIDWVNIEEEVGDLFWYVSNYSNLHNITPEICHLNVNTDTSDFVNIILYAGYLLDIDKKWFAYGKEPDKTIINNDIDALYTLIVFWCTEYDIDIQNSMDINIQKLKARYPDKFDTEKAINRDLETERNILEGK